AGSRDQSTQIVTRITTGSSGSSLLFGQDKRMSAADAAQINGTASHALDFDDCSNTLGGHPSAPILPVIFALADEYGASGRDFIAAYVAGFETECKLSMCVNFHQYTKGWHPTATIGIFGGTAAACYLLKLDEEKTTLALSVAASMAAGLKANLGTDTKPLHVGNCARSALFATLLAREGFTANPRVFEHKMGYLNVFNGEGNYDTSKIFPQWGTPWDIVKPGIAIKQYTCCGSTHPAVDATLDLTREHDLKPELVAKIETWTHPRRLEHTNRPDPRSDVDARFSVQYVVSRALADRCVLDKHFEHEAYKEPRIQSLLKRVQSTTYTTAQFAAENHFGAEVRITLTDGRVVSKKLDQPYGRTSANPLSAERLKAKFDGCISGIVHDANMMPLYNAIQGFEKLKDVRELTSLISASPVRAAVAA
ncbi:MAG TPA: MmgE/PrpD family protein, partial [Burkholderiales bacterium]|nr:MmgE/PrpD family protein [Burkholderiales bacterium]